jgi:TolB-like protein
MDVREQLQAALGSAFAIERELMGGGMSRVFVATETALNRKVAIKVLPPDLASAVSAERFRREIQVVAQLQHPHIVPVHIAGEAGGLLFYTMPFIEGETLRQRLQREGKLPVNEALTMLTELADALAYAHERGVVHRDIKPENVLLNGTHAMLADFGVAKALSASTGAGALTTAGLSLGTPAYMSPEQITGDTSVDHRADIYSLGLVAYEMLGGTSPFDAKSPQAMIAAHLSTAPRSLAASGAMVQPGLARLVMRCLEKDPARRPQTAAELATAFRALGGSGEQADRGRPIPRRSWVVAGGAVGIALLAFAAWRIARRAPASAAESQIKSIAVMPLENMSRDSADAYFVDGLSDELATALGKVPQLVVAPRTSVLYFKKRNLSTRQMGESLHVAAVLEGRVRRDESTVRVTAELTRTRDGSGIWNDVFQAARTGVFAMQDDITRAIVEKLQLTLGASPAASRGASNPAAHELYLKGHYFWDQRTQAGFMTAVKYFEDAVRLDSTYALAYAGLADSWILLSTFGYVAPADGFEKGRTAARRALLLDSTLAEPHTSLGMIASFFDWDWKTAEREFDRAAVLDPRYANTFLFRAWLLAFTGRLEEALAAVRHAQEIDPLNRTIGARVATMLDFLGRYDEAERQLRATLALDPTYFITRSDMALALTLEGRYEEALQYLAPVGPDYSRAHLAATGYLYARMGRRAAALAFIDTLRAVQRRQHVPRGPIVATYVGLGDLDAAFAELTREVQERDWGVVEAGLDRRYEPLWKDPRYAAIRRATNLEGVPPGAVRP